VEVLIIIFLQSHSFFRSDTMFYSYTCSQNFVIKNFVIWFTKITCHKNVNCLHDPSLKVNLCRRSQLSDTSYSGYAVFRSQSIGPRLSWQRFLMVQLSLLGRSPDNTLKLVFASFHSHFSSSFTNCGSFQCLQKAYCVTGHGISLSYIHAFMLVPLCLDFIPAAILVTCWGQVLCWYHVSYIRVCYLHVCPCTHACTRSHTHTHTHARTHRV
jgi:hypothetical protein